MSHYIGWYRINGVEHCTPPGYWNDVMTRTNALVHLVDETPRIEPLTDAVPQLAASALTADEREALRCARELVADYSDVLRDPAPVLAVLDKLTKDSK